MYDELIDDGDRQNGGQTTFKIVKVRLGQSFFSLNDNLNQPVFTKRNLIYDKYELAKLISYQQFQLLFRPFKTNPAFKDYVRWWKIFIGFGIFYILLTIGMLLLFDPKEDKTNELVFFIYLLVFTIILIVLAFRYNAKIRQAKSHLKEFCETLNAQQNQVSFRVVKTKMEKIGERSVQVEISELQNSTISLDYIYVQSNRLREDNQYIKLYKLPKESIKFSCSNEDSPIYTEEQFSFDKEKLNRFITFDEFQRLLRPFKANHFHRRMLFWQKFMLACIISLFLLFIPLIIWDDDELIAVIIVASYSGFVYFFIILGMCKAINNRSKMLLQFKDYCSNLSFNNPRIQIILHLKDKKVGKSETINQLYSFEIQNKQRPRFGME